MIRRTAVRILAGRPGAAKRQLVAALTNDDAIVRRAALHAVVAIADDRAVSHIETALRDKSASVRQAAAAELIAIQPRTPRIQALLTLASRDDAPGVREQAAAALWPFYKKVVLLRQRKDWDHDVKVVRKIDLPDDGWKFKLDPKRDGHLHKWFDPAFDDGKWDTITIRHAWEKSGFEYDGVAWYRRAFDLPAKLDHMAVEIHLEAVDESAWVWINGQYVGQHDIGGVGWDKPFNLDATKEVKWGVKNHITVRVLDAKYAGGIWKPAWIEVLK